jgi:hypothetical protein
VLQGGAGGNMKVTGYNYGTGQPVPLNLSVDGALTNLGGDLTQITGRLGVPKAMIWVNANRLINRCYNGVTGVSAINVAGQSACGFTVSVVDGFSAKVDFGFAVNNSFFSVVVKGTAGASAGVFTVGERSNLTTNQAIVDINIQSTPFQLIVY